jgi:hypothetical protein
MSFTTLFLRFRFLALNGTLGTTLSDFLWAQGLLLTSPLVATLGLTLTVPVAMLGDFFIHDAQFNRWFLIGSLGVLVGFILVNVAQNQDAANAAAAAAAEAAEAAARNNAASGAKAAASRSQGINDSDDVAGYPVSL